MRGRGPALRTLALGGLALALLGYLAAPDFPGFTVLPLAGGLILLILAGPRQWRADLAALASPAGRAGLKVAAALLTSLGLALAAGVLNRLPSFDFNDRRPLALAPQTEELLARLDRPATVTVHLGAQDARLPRVRELMSHYQRAAGGRLTVTYLNPQLDAADEAGGPRLVAPNSALVTAEGFRENVSPITEEALNGALYRLLHPEHRLIYFLNTFGEKLAQDRGPAGLSQWADDLTNRRFIALDYYWPDETPLPREASALVLAGPKAPLGEFREKLLLDYVRQGGRLMVMVDPLTVAVSGDFWAAFGLVRPEGLVVDPEANLAGTGEGFVVAGTYPGHPLTRGLAAPTLWPLVGAFAPAEPDKSRSEPAPTVLALVETSASAWLETDPASFTAGATRYQPDADRPGPLVLAVAGELPGGGRLVALADSDFAANGFRGFPGNRAITLSAIQWLLDGPAAPLAPPEAPPSLVLGRVSGRLVFWLPAVVWPALVLGVWFGLYRCRHRRRGGVEE